LLSPLQRLGCRIRGQGEGRKRRRKPCRIDRRQVKPFPSFPVCFPSTLLTLQTASPHVQDSTEKTSAEERLRETCLS